MVALIECQGQNRMPRLYTVLVPICQGDVGSFGLWVNTCIACPR